MLRVVAELLLLLALGPEDVETRSEFRHRWNLRRRYLHASRAFHSHGPTARANPCGAFDLASRIDLRGQLDRRALPGIFGNAGYAHGPDLVLLFVDVDAQLAAAPETLQLGLALSRHLSAFRRQEHQSFVGLQIVGF